MTKETSFLEIDVREDLKLKIEPFDKIMGAVQQLKEGQNLILHAPFNPVPLHKVLKGKGFGYEAEEIEHQHWKITYTQQGADEK